MEDKQATVESGEVRARRLPLLFSSRPPVVASHYALLGVLLAALGWTGLWSVFSQLPEPASPWLSLSTALPASALVLLKRRAPGLGLAAALVLFAVDLSTFGGLVPMLVVLELLYAHLIASDAARRRLVRGQIVAGTVTLALYALVLSRDMPTAVMAGLQFGALFGFTYWYSNSMAQSRELVSLYRQRSESAERLAELDRQAAVQGERDRMARELHDVVAGHISAIAIRSEAALGAGGAAGGGLSAAGETPERRALRDVRDASLGAHTALRSMIRVLRSGGEEIVLPPGRAEMPGLVEAANASGVRAELVDEVMGELPAAIDQALGSVVREALANSARHSSGARVLVRVFGGRHSVGVEIASTGGTALARPELPGSGMGLELLTERVRALGGQLSAGPEPGDRWVVRASLPREGSA